MINTWGNRAYVYRWQEALLIYPSGEEGEGSQRPRQSAAPMGTGSEQRQELSMQNAGG